LLTPKPDAVCKKLGIPKRLRRNNREPFNQFNDGGESLYRWFSPRIDFDYEGNLSAAAIEEIFKPPRDISCNREFFCQHSTDVLYNTKELPHRYGHGVIRTSIELIDNHTFLFTYSRKKGSTENLIITLKVIHSPEECMYPHSEILVLKEGERIKDVKPNSLKTVIRQELSQRFKVCHEPNPHFKLM
jgi:hypothetical protein